jgi:transcriptional regulator GlxA family with amidase domain
MYKVWRVGILLFNEVEVLDFAGPYEVFSLATVPGQGDKPFAVTTVSEQGTWIRARNGLQVMPEYSFADAPAFDIVIIPGGYGAEEIEIHNAAVIAWIKAQQMKVQLLASVCTGALLLAKAGVLAGRRATTHWLDIDRLAAEFPAVSVQRDVKYVDEGQIITAGGISAGINMSFYIVSKLAGEAVAVATAKRMEYDWVP